MKWTATSTICRKRKMNGGRRRSADFVTDSRTRTDGLRREMTPAEKILWEELRANKLGVHFRRQQVIQGFIVDFYCHRAGLVVEVDGDIHDLQKEEDERREKVLTEMGLRIVRFGNDEVGRNLYVVVEKIKVLAEK